MLYFILGFISGIASLVLYAHIKVTKREKEEDLGVDKMKKDVDLLVSVRARFLEVQKITDQQMSLLSGAERPSASALHSKHQNSIIGELKKLEEEKIAIFRSILQDGLDPNLSMIVDGKPSTMKMSEAVSLYESNQKQVVKTETNIPRSNLRLVINEDDNVGSKEKET